MGDRRGSELPVVVPAQPPRLARVLDAAADQGIDLAVVDTAPRIEQGAVAATVDVIRAVAPATRFLCVLNAVPPRGPRQPQARWLLDDMGVPVCAASLGLRAAVDYAAAAGASAQEYEPRSKAAAEIAAVYDVVRQAVGLSASREADLPTAPKADLSTSRKANLSAGRQDRLSTSTEDHLPTRGEDDSSTLRQPGLSTSATARKSTSGAAHGNGRQAR